MDITTYILTFLLYGHTEALSRIRLAGSVDWTLRYPSMKDPSIVRDGELVVVSPDLIYNTFFYISRAEELLNDQRDEHGRFLASYSILDKADRLSQPMVDIYAQQLMKALDLPIPSDSFANVCLTHDIDTLDYYHHLRGAIGGILRGHWKEVWASLRDIHDDPAYTFPWLEDTDADFEVIYFVKQTQGRGYDYPQYDLRRVPKLNAKYGLHSSYYGELPKRSLTVASTTDILPINTGKFSVGDKLLHRSHYLRCSIAQMERLVAYGVTDDYTMGFADKAGFRLQTCRPVRWINPKTLELTDLVLHPLTIMDCTLSNSQYMNLNEEEALAYCQQLIEQVRKYHGELVLLWHNSVFGEAYHRELYPKLIALL